MKELRIAIIGCGRIADQHAMQIGRVPGSRIVAVCDSEPLMADQLAERFGISARFDDVDRLLKEARPDVVHLTTPPQTHCSLTTRCLDAGCHVYVEKPFSLDLQEAHAMLVHARDRGLRITVGHNAQFSPEMLEMRDLVRRGALGGAPIHIESIYTYRLSDAGYVPSLLGDGNHWVRALPGKLLHNLISHGIAKVAEFLDGGDLTVVAHGSTSQTLLAAGEAGLVDELRVVISDRRRATAYFTFTTQISPPVQELRLFGPDGAVIVDNAHRTVVRVTRANADLKSYLNFFAPPLSLARQYVRNAWNNVKAFKRAEFHMDAGMKNLIEAFYRSIRESTPPPIPDEEILRTAAIMDEIFKQLDQGGSADEKRAVLPV